MLATHSHAVPTASPSSLANTESLKKDIAISTWHCTHIEYIDGEILCIVIKGLYVVHKCNMLLLVPGFAVSFSSHARKKKPYKV